MKKIIVANWKNHPDTLAEAQGIVEAVNDYFESAGERSQTAVVFCPPFVFTEEVGKMISQSHLAHRAFLGAQDIATEDKDAMTGEVSGPQLVKLGVRYVIIGHSERRWKLGETDEDVNKKLKAVLHNELIPIVCIGERSKDGNWQNEIQEQVRATFVDLSADDIAKCLIAYEPVWAISTSPGARPDTPISALQSVKFIRDILRNEFGAGDIRFLYGGSITDRNVAQFLSVPEFSGVLVGGASVRKDEFVHILADESHIAR